jgi:hypothetical protein
MGPLIKMWRHSSAYGDAQIAVTWDDEQGKYAHTIVAVTANGRSMFARSTIHSDELSGDVLEVVLGVAIQNIVKTVESAPTEEFPVEILFEQVAGTGRAKLTYHPPPSRAHRCELLVDDLDLQERLRDSFNAAVAANSVATVALRFPTTRLAAPRCLHIEGITHDGVLYGEFL